MTKLINVDDLIKITRLVAVSPYIKNYSPLKLILLSQSGMGKTTLILHWTSRNIAIFTDISKTGIMDTLIKEPNKNMFIVPDMIKITNKKSSTSKDTISMLNAVTEEGLFKVKLWNVEHDLKGKKVGLMTSTTKASWAQTKDGFIKIGFPSRFIIASYKYSKKTYDAIMESIYNSEYIQKQNITNQLKRENGFKLVREDIKIPYELAKKLNNQKNNSFRTQKHLQQLSICHAYLYGRKVVNESDVNEILRLDKLYFNENYNEI